jgi:RecA-family ATPase
METSRWLVWGETGVGKTLFALEVAAAIAAGQPFLGSEGRGKNKTVIYLDGELPAETFKERMELVARRYGKDLTLYGHNRDALLDGEMPPLNSAEGQA